MLSAGGIGGRALRHSLIARTSIRTLCAASTDKNYNHRQSQYRKSQIVRGKIPNQAKKQYQGKVNELRKTWMKEREKQLRKKKKAEEKEAKALQERIQAKKKKEVEFQRAIKEQRKRLNLNQKNAIALRKDANTNRLRKKRREQQDYYIRLLRLMAKNQDSIITKETIDERINEKIFEREVNVPGFQHPSLHMQDFLEMDRNELSGMQKNVRDAYLERERWWTNKIREFVSDPNLWRTIKFYRNFQQDFPLWLKDGTLTQAGRAPIIDLYLYIEEAHGKETLRSFFEKNQRGSERWNLFNSSSFDKLSEIEEELRQDGHYNGVVVYDDKTIAMRAPIPESLPNYNPEIEKLSTLLRHLQNFSFMYIAPDQAIPTNSEVVLEMIDWTKSPEEIAKWAEEYICDPPGYVSSREDDSEQEDLAERELLEKLIQRNESLVKNLPEGEDLGPYERFVWSDPMVEGMKEDRLHEIKESYFHTMDNTLERFVSLNDHDALEMSLKELGVYTHGVTDPNFISRLLHASIARRLGIDPESLVQYLRDPSHDPVLAREIVDSMEEYSYKDYLFEGILESFSAVKTQYKNNIGTEEQNNEEGIDRDDDESLEVRLLRLLGLDSDILSVTSGETLIKYVSDKFHLDSSEVRKYLISVSPEADSLFSKLNENETVSHKLSSLLPGFRKLYSHLTTLYESEPGDHSFEGGEELSSLEDDVEAVYPNEEEEDQEEGQEEGDEEEAEPLIDPEEEEVNWELDNDDDEELKPDDGSFEDSEEQRHACKNFKQILPEELHSKALDPVDYEDFLANESDENEEPFFITEPELMHRQEYLVRRQELFMRDVKEEIEDYLDAKRKRRVPKKIPMQPPNLPDPYKQQWFAEDDSSTDSQMNELFGRDDDDTYQPMTVVELLRANDAQVERDLALLKKLAEERMRNDLGYVDDSKEEFMKTGVSSFLKNCDRNGITVDDDLIDSYKEYREKQWQLMNHGILSEDLDPETHAELRRVNSTVIINDNAIDHLEYVFKTKRLISDKDLEGLSKYERKLFIQDIMVSQYLDVRPKLRDPLDDTSDEDMYFFNEDFFGPSLTGMRKVC